MRVAIQTMGTRGDVQPYVALARGLRDAGHEPRITAPAQFADFVGRDGLPFAPLPAEFLDLMETPEAKAAMTGRKSLRASLALMSRVKPMMGRLFDALWRSAREEPPEVLVYHPKSLVAPDIAEALGIPAILASPLPGFSPTAAFPSPMLPFGDLGPLNAPSHDLFVRAGEAAFAGLLKRWRRDVLGLPPRRGRRRPPTLYAFSPAVLPVPPEWRDDVRVAGYWFLDDRTGWRPDAALQRFLDAGPPPVYVGFGSIPSGDPARTTALVLAALGQAGQRGLLAAGWGGLEAATLPGSVHLIQEAPHDRLFPLVAATVHHGGAGTTAAGLRAGKPAIVCPFFGDQPFWGRRVAALGVGPQPIPQRRLDADRLAAAIREAVGDRAMAARAERLGQVIRAERGVAEGIAFIEAIAAAARA